MKKLIINADDFGLHNTVNNGIIQGYTKGSLTSTSIMPTGEAFEHALALAEKHPMLGLGIHLTLVGGGRTVLDGSKIPSLVCSEGMLAANYGEFFKKYLVGKISLSEVRCELEAQVEKVVATGVHVTHLDSHQHLHIVPGIIDIVIDIAKTYSIPAMRISDEPYFFTGGYPIELARLIGRCGLTFLARLARRKANYSGIRTPSAFFGMLAGGNMQERFLMNIIKQLPDGVSEIMMHPGESDELNSTYQWQYHWTDELAAIVSNNTRCALEFDNIKLVSFRELTHE